MMLRYGGCMRRLFTLVSLLLLGATLTAQRDAPPPDESIALRHAHIVNVRDGRITENATIVLKGGRIASIGSDAAPPGARVIDLQGKYVLPGLIDAHTHATDLAGFRRALESGVTTVRSSGVSNYADIGFQTLVRKGSIPGPDVVSAGYHVRPQLAEAAFLSDPSFADLMSGVTTVEKLRRAVRMNLSHGVDWIKILATERAGTADTDPRKQVYTEDEIQAVVEEAAAKNVPVQAHAHGDEGGMAAVRAGVRSIEHGTYLSDPTLRLMKEKGTYFVPTYATVVDVAEPGGDYDVAALRIRGAHMLPRLRSTVERAHKLGVKIVTGADTSYGPNSLTRISHEMLRFVEMGFSALEAIQSATILNAEMLRADKAIGLIQVGYEADVIAVDRNPLVDITAVQDPLLVISNGRIGLNRLDVAREAGKSTK
jgi:imidazolonepropionase-like amidohydrolase